MSRVSWIILGAVAAALVGWLGLRALTMNETRHISREVTSTTPPVQSSSAIASVAAVPAVAWMLRATMPGSGTHIGAALIGRSNEEPKIYSVGEMLPEQFRLLQVARDHAVIEKDGVRRILYLLQREALSVSIAATPSNVAGAAPSENRAAMDGIIRSSAESTPDGKPGLRVVPGSNTSLFFRFGLLPGDIVTAINGEPVSATQDGQDALAALLSRPESSLTVVRAGRTLTWPIQVGSVMPNVDSRESGQ
jgi:type II secretion system protein C